ncbi:MAG: MBL fold metallo-hydrolase [Marinicella sp.]
MKKHTHILLILLAFSSVATSQNSDENLTQKSVNKAQEVINLVVEAYGGAERLNQLNTVSIDFDTTNFAVNQSRNPGPPWDENKVKGTTMLDFENQQFVTQFKSMSDHQDFHGGTVINGEDSHQINYRAQTNTPIAEPNFMNTAGPFIRVTPPLLVKQLMQRSQTAHYLGQADVDGNPHDVISFVMEVGPAISLYFDQKTHMLNRSERVLGAFGLVAYRFHEHQKVDGIPFNQRFELFVNEQNNMLRKNKKTEINQSIAAHTKLDDGLTATAAIQPDPVARQKITEGVYLIGGNGTYAMFIEMNDHVIAVGGTAGIPERIALLKEVVPNKPVKYGVLTHHHNDHILGAQAYADEGAIVIAAAAHEKVISDATENKSLKIETVNKTRNFISGEREVQLIDIGPTEHTAHLLIAYLPKEGIMFEADHFNIRTAGNVPPASPAARSFAAALKSNDIKVKSILSAHSPMVASMDDLKEAIKKADQIAKK